MRKSSLSSYLACLILAACATPTESSQPPQAPRPVPTKAGVEPPRHITTVEGIEEYQLNNGLRILLLPDASKQTITVNITYLVGSRHEGYGETGMAHLLEHMMFKGTPRHPDIPAELTAHGTRPNGTTWYDRTNYYETFAATEENLTWALDLEADRMVHSLIDKRDLDSEMTVVRNEFEIAENYPQMILEERVMSTAYLWHNYGKSTIGARSDIEKVPVEKLKTFYRTWYQPDNAVLVVSGQIDRDHTLKLIAQKFGAIPRPSRILPETYTVEPPQDGERRVLLHRVGDTQEMAIVYHIPAGSHPDFAAVSALAAILAEEPSGRLYKALVETQLAAQVDATPYALKEPGVLYLQLGIRSGSRIAEAESVTLQLLDNLQSDPIRQEEVERSKAILLKDWQLTMRNSEDAALEMSEWAALGDWRTMFLHRDRLRQLTAADINRVARLYLRPVNRTVGLFYPTNQPDRVLIPNTPDVESLVSNYKGETGPALGQPFNPTPQNIEARTQRITLPVGLKLVMMPKQTRGSTVALSLALYMGDSKSLRNQALAGKVAIDMLLMGTDQLNQQQLQDELNRLQSKIRLGGTAYRMWAEVETTRQALPQVLALLTKILRRPRFAPEQFEITRQQALLRYENLLSDPFQKGFTQLMRHLSPWPVQDVRYVASPEERIAQIKQLRRDQVKHFHSVFFGAQGMRVAAVGDFDPALLAQHLKQHFGDWSSRQPYRRLPYPFRNVPPQIKQILTPGKESAVYVTGLNIDLTDEHPDYPALVLANFITGGGFLNSRLATRIREQEGLSYGVNSSLQAGPLDHDASFTAYALYAPQNDKRLRQAFADVLSKIHQQGFSEAEVAAAKSGWLQERQVSRGQDMELADQLWIRDHQGRTLQWDQKLEQRIADLTPEQVHQAFKKHIDTSRLSVVIAGDLASVDKQ